VTAPRPRSNWAGNHVYRAARLHRPETLEQARAIVAAAPRLRVLGTRHAFSAIADSAEQISLDGLPRTIAVDHDAATVTVAGAVTYGELAAALEPAGLALANLASLPHISVAGAIATATHGSGDRLGNLATAVAGLELVTSAGELVAVRRGDPGFDGVVVGLGALGAVVRVTLDVETHYEVSQRVFECLGWDALDEHLDAITAAGDSVSVFTLWGERAGAVWVKRRTDDGRDELFGALPAGGERHPIPGLDPVHCTAQRGVAGPWSDRLPHFRMGFTPSNGDELQSEYLLPRAQARAAIAALRELGPRIGPLLQVSEIRTIAADSLWLSPQHERDCVGIHFTWKPEQPAVERVLAAIEAALAPFAARPHWGKLFLAGGDAIAPLYPRRDDFVALAGRLDPRGAFANDWLAASLL
jgi:xylitol oxidase